ncbi:MAG: WG repeat-containing protein, partial [Bacteroidota bacterium]
MSKHVVAFNLLLLLTLGYSSALAQIEIERPYLIRKDGYFGFIDEYGEILIQPKYTEVYPFGAGLTAVEENESWFFINERGERRSRFFDAINWGHSKDDDYIAQ